jgi:hypothetical protein
MPDPFTKDRVVAVLESMAPAVISPLRGNKAPVPGQTGLMEQLGEEQTGVGGVSETPPPDPTVGVPEPDPEAELRRYRNARPSAIKSMMTDPLGRSAEATEAE